ncbi:MAG TPA: transketolase C-terminal domain-containing protein [Rectinema sp.]|jgi:transketolase|nr:transketolase C-terminal domain-containing protein [Rectinema sp.]HQB06237.1 transketolase C-terminal domain-containing protein [Rectinema sp.]
MGETMRDAFGKYLAKLGNYRDDLVVLDADVSSSTKSSYFAKAFPNRFFNVGVAESNMVDIAGGLATAGLRPVVNAFAIFLSLKATDQIRNVLAYNRLPVVLVGAYGGLSDSFDGASHQSLEDIAIMRSIPGLEVIIPADSSEALRALEYALEQDCPVYIRLNRNQIPDLEARSDDEPLTRIRALRSGCDVTIAASGICVSIALKAAEILADYGISAEVLDVASIKPLDISTLSASVARTGRLVTAEEHSIMGGLGSACVEALAEKGIAFRLRRIGVRDCYTESGPYEILLAKYGINAEEIARQASALMS